MSKTWILPCLFAFAMVGCNRTSQEPAVPAAQQQAAADLPAKPAPPPKPRKRVAGALKADLPEGFVLPFAFHRLYDNTGRKDGKAQRRVLVEYLDKDAAAVQASLTEALKAKGFADPAVSKEAGIVVLDFARGDDSSVQAKIEAGRKNPRAPNAQGTVHLVWTSGQPGRS